MTDKSELEKDGQTYDWSTVTGPWVTSATEYGRRPPAEDREFRSFTATLPPKIASTPFSFGSKVERNLVDATLEIAALEASATADVTAISGFLLRTESRRARRSSASTHLAMTSRGQWLARMLPRQRWRWPVLQPL